MYSFTLSLTKALDGGEWPMSFLRSLTPENDQTNTVLKCVQ